MFGGKTIKGKLMQANLILVLLPVIIFSAVLYVSMKAQIKKESLENNEKALGQVAQNIDAVLEASINLTNLYYFDNTLNDILWRLDEMTIVEKLQQRNALETQFLYSNIILGYKGCYAAVYDRTGESFFDWSMVGYDFDAFDVWNMVKDVEDEFSNGLIRIGDSVQTVSYFDEQRKVLFIIRRLLAPYSSNNLGMLVLGIDEQVLYQRYQDMVDSDNKIYILNEKGVVISTSDKACLGLPFQTSYSEKLLAGKPVRESGLLVSVESLDRAGWMIVQETSQKSLLTPLKNIYSLMLCTIVISLGLSVWLSYYLSSTIAKPIVRLTRFTQSLDSENLGQHILVEGKDEVGELAQAFNSLTTRLQTSIDEMIFLEREKRKAEYEMLQAKINPHFLFNTLSTVRCLITEGKLKQSEDVLICLGRLLRATLGHHDELITIGQEIERLEDYLMIQKMRYQDRFVYYIQVEEALHSCSIIQLVLQPIVENAIFHGGENESGQIVIQIQAREEGDDIVFSISDTGNGVSQERIAQIMDKNYETPRHLFSGVGLRNIIDRIALYYGQEYGLWIQSRIGEGTTVLIRIPKQEMGEEHAGTGS